MKNLIAKRWVRNFNAFILHLYLRAVSRIYKSWGIPYAALKMNISNSHSSFLLKFLIPRLGPGNGPAMKLLHTIFPESPLLVWGSGNMDCLAKCFQVSNLVEWLERWLRTNTTSGGQGSNPLSEVTLLSTQCIYSNLAKLDSTYSEEVIRK